MMAQNHCEKIWRMAFVWMTERSQGLHSGGSGLNTGRKPQNRFPTVCTDTVRAAAKTGAPLFAYRTTERPQQM